MAQDEQGEQGGEGDAGGHVEPDAGKSQRPEKKEHEQWKKQGGGDGDEGGVKRFANGDHIALGGKAAPMKQQRPPGTAPDHCRKR